MLTGEVADAYVVADAVKSEFTAIPIKDEFLKAVVAPFAGSVKTTTTKHRLITSRTENGRVGHDWTSFCRKAGLKLEDLQSGAFLRCSHYMLALQLAKNGHGVALVPDFIAESDIRLGILVPFSDVLLPSKRTYQLCIKKSRENEPSLKILSDWFKKKVAEANKINASSPAREKMFRNNSPNQDQRPERP